GLLPGNEAIGLEPPERLRKRHRLDARVAREECLRGRLAVLLEPTQRRHDRVMGLRDAKRVEHGAELALPQGGQLPEQEARTLVGVRMLERRPVIHGGPFRRVARSAPACPSLLPWLGQHHKLVYYLRQPEFLIGSDSTGRNGCVLKFE